MQVKVTGPDRGSGPGWVGRYPASLIMQVKVTGPDRGSGPGWVGRYPASLIMQVKVTGPDRGSGPGWVGRYIHNTYIELFLNTTLDPAYCKFGYDEGLTETRMHSSGMRTARLLTVCVCVCMEGCLPGGEVSAWGRGVSDWGGVYLEGMSAWGVPCGLSHHAFDVTCMLPPHQLRPSNSAAAYIQLVGHVTCKACWDTHTPTPVDRQTAVKNITFANYVCGR